MKKIYTLKFFSFIVGVIWHRWQTFISDYFREFSKKFETIPMRYSEARGKLIYEKNLKLKISWQTPFKALLSRIRVDLIGNNGKSTTLEIQSTMVAVSETPRNLRQCRVGLFLQYIKIAKYLGELRKTKISRNFKKQKKYKKISCFRRCPWSGVPPHLLPCRGIFLFRKHENLSRDIPL